MTHATPVVELHVKPKSNSVVVIEYDDGLDVGKSGVDYFHYSDRNDFIKYICDKVDFPEIDIEALQNKRIKDEYEIRYLRMRVKALEKYMQNSGVNLKRFYTEYVEHEALVQYNMENLIPGKKE